MISRSDECVPSMSAGIQTGFGPPLGRPVALAHDYLLVMRGAERTFLEMARCWPEAPITTLLYDEVGTDGVFGDRKIATSYLNRLGSGQARFRRLLPLLPGAARSLRVRQPLLVSSSSAFAHGIRADGVHVCYCHSPFRYAWFEQDEALAQAPAPLRPVLRGILGRTRAWDRRVSAEVTAYIANSRLTQERIGEYWGREATVIHPPVEVDRFAPGEPEDFFLVVGELVGHKRVDLALEACRRVGARVKVVGTGPEAKRLSAAYAREGVSFIGRVGDDELASLYQSSLALIVPNLEEFGITAVEAQAAGRPVLAVDGGGARETVIDGETGVLAPSDAERLAEAIRYTSWTSFSPEACVRSARRFAAPVFRRRLVEELDRIVGLAG
jgi:glycosyltransferase involved in cell wall biosynthesis